MGAQEPLPRREHIDLIKNNLFSIKFKNNNRLRPQCFIEDSVLSEWRKPWEDSVIVKLLGKTLGFFTMRDRLQVLWKPSGDIDLVDIGHGFFMVKFDVAVDREKAMGEG